MVMLDTRFVQKNLESNANTCTITETSRSFGADEYRTITLTETDQTSLSCWVQILSEEEELVKEGEARAGDLIFWFDSANESFCVQGNKITFDSKTYEMSDVRKFDVGGTTYLIEVRTKKI